MTLQAGDYSITPVNGPVDEPLREEVTTFWLANGAIPARDMARQRADQLVCVARDADGQIVGVNTAYVTDQPGTGRRYYVYRMFVRPQDRRFHLAHALMRAAVDTLRARPVEPAVAGVVLVTENKKLMRRGAQRILTTLGWRRTGADQRGLDVWVFDFEPGR